MNAPAEFPTDRVDHAERPRSKVPQFSRRYEDDDIPDPPDNADEWRAYPESFTDRVAAQFERGIAMGEERDRQKVVRAIAVDQARAKEDAERKAARAAARRRRRRS